MHRLKVFFLGCLAACFLGSSSHGAISGPIHLAALLNTNDPTSVLAWLRLTGSNLDFVITPPRCSTRVDIVATTNGALPGRSFWSQSAIHPAADSVIIIEGIDIDDSGATIIRGRTNNVPNSGGGGGGPGGPQVPCGNPHVPTPTLGTITNEIALGQNEIEQLLNNLCLMIFIKNQGTTGEAAQIVVLDTDGDGVLDSRDACPDTPVGSLVNSDGCSIDQLAPCDGGWRNHGDFVVHFQRVTAEFQATGLITTAQARELNRACAQSDCGK